LSGIRAIRNKTPRLSDEGIQQLEHELNAARSQTILSTGELTADLTRMRHQLPQMQGELDALRLVQEYSQIVMRSLEINKEVFTMALNIKDDLKELLYGRIDELKGGKNKGWFVAMSFAMTMIFMLTWILFKQWIVTAFGLPVP